MGVVLLMMTIGGLIVAAILLAVSYFAKMKWLRTFVLGGVAVWLTGYLILLFVASTFSQEKNLGLNEPKEFCGFYLDCHMHTAVSQVRKTRSIGDKTADGEFYIVTVKVFSNAKQASLGLASVEAKVADEDRREYWRDAEAEQKLETQPPFDRRISPVESFEKQIVFDLPSDVKNPRLDIKEGSVVKRLIEKVLIGDEDSLFHRRIRFNLEPLPSQAGLR